MKVFLRYFAALLLVAVASVLYIIDALISEALVTGMSSGFLTFGIYTIYASLVGLICGYISITVQNKNKGRLENIDNNAE